MAISEALGTITVAGPSGSTAALTPVEVATAPRGIDVTKRAVDLILGVIVLVLLLPVILLVALVVAVFDGRPVFFRQERVGRHGETFTIYKFRTMVPDAESRLIDLREQNERHGPLFKLTLDPRVTRVGRLLRESSLDELPQLFNVLAGSMSLVGPRPALPDETMHFDHEFLVRHMVRPGITGLWQVHSRDESSFENYQRLDLYYVRNRSMRMDLIILIRTVPTVLGRAWSRLVKGRPDPLEAAARADVAAETPSTVPAPSERRAS